jgi:hypothetical protein
MTFNEPYRLLPKCEDDPFLHQFEQKAKNQHGAFALLLLINANGNA